MFGSITHTRNPQQTPKFRKNSFFAANLDASGSKPIQELTARYVVHANTTPRIISYWRNLMSQSDFNINNLGNNYYGIEIHYTGLNLQPGETFSEIQFQVSNPDWSNWNFNADPSGMPDSVGAWRINPQLQIFDKDGNVIWGGNFTYDSTTFAYPQNPVTPIVSCTGINQWSARSYVANEQAVDNGHLYQCRPWPYSGWCAQAAYEPGVGAPWSQAWLDMGICQ